MNNFLKAFLITLGIWFLVGIVCLFAYLVSIIDNVKLQLIVLLVPTFIATFIVMFLIARND